MQKNHEEIDLVVPWVDGSDVRWQEEKSKYEQERSPYNTMFFRDWGLMRYWFRGVEKNLPWIRRIHFVTWGHLPPWLNTEHPKLHIVRHEDYIPRQYLPTFSANPIELNIHRIKGLSEQFIYTNDDIFFLGAVPPEYYFHNGMPCDCLHLMPITEMTESTFGHILWNNVSCINRNFKLQQCLQKEPNSFFYRGYSDKIRKDNETMANLRAFPGFGEDHFPNPYRKSTFHEVWEREYALLNEICFHRFRSNEDLSQGLMRYWQLAEGSFHPSMKNGCSYVTVSDPLERLRDTILSDECRIVCLNEGEEDVDFARRSEYIRELFQLILPEVSDFEKF